MAKDQTSRGVTVSAREWRIFKWAPQKSTFHPNCCVAEKISCLHITHMRRYKTKFQCRVTFRLAGTKIFPAPYIWANSGFLEAHKKTVARWYHFRPDIPIQASPAYPESAKPAADCPERTVACEQQVKRRQYSRGA